MQQNHTYSTRVSQHALVLGPSGHVQSDPTVPAQSGDSAIQPGPAQEPVKSEPTCLAPRASAFKEQGFSEAVAARIEAPQRGSTRSVYEAKWTIFTNLTKTLDLQTVFLLALGSDKRLVTLSMLGYIKTSDTSQTVLRCLCTPHSASYPRTSCLRRTQIVWPRWLYQPWPPLWTSHLRVTSPYVQSEPCAITWTGPQISGRTRS